MAPPTRRLLLGAFLLLVAFAAARVVARRWLCDDSFISFRYLQHLLSGDGLVYNAGERVEGYTNLLWILVLAPLVRAGLPVEMAAQLLGALAYAVIVALLCAWWRAREKETLAFPVAAALVLALDDFHVWATGGLETSFFSALVLGGLLLACRKRPTLWTDLAASALLGLSVLARADGLLFVACACARPFLPITTPTCRGRRAMALALPALALVAAQVVFKLGYYRELFPTAFYSKSALRPYYSQGLLYLGLWLAKNWVVLPVAIVGVVLGRRARSGSRSAPSDSLYLALAGLAYAAYVAHSGGDFMFARRLIPALPLLFIGLEHALSQVRGPAVRASLAGVLIVGALVPLPIFRPERPRLFGISDEPRFYPQEVLALRRAQGDLVGDLLRRTPARVMLQGGMCSFGYYSRFPYLIEMTGLTQYSLAKLPLARRGWVGHEKAPTTRWLDENGVDLVMWEARPPFAPPATGPEHDAIYFGTLAKASILRYDDAVMDSLRGRPDVIFTPIEVVLDRARRQMARRGLADRREIFDYLDGYYFRSGGPRALAARAEFEKWLEARPGKPRP